LVRSVIARTTLHALVCVHDALDVKPPCPLCHAYRNRTGTIVNAVTDANTFAVGDADIYTERNPYTDWEPDADVLLDSNADPVCQPAINGQPEWDQNSNLDQ
jgi:hypothetical protein